MLIKLDLRSLSRTQWHEYVVRFVLGGIVTVVTGLLGTHYGPVIGGLFLAFPAIFPATATLLEKHERDKKRKAGIPFTIRGRLAAALDARGAVMGALGGMAFAAVACSLLPRSGLGVALPLALVCWVAVSSLLWYVCKHHRHLAGPRPRPPSRRLRRERNPPQS